MNDFETALMIDKIKSQKYGKGLIEDITKIKEWCDNNFKVFEKATNYTSLCNVYKCLTLAISRYITKYSSPLPMYVYKIKRNMEEKILSEEFLDPDKLTYEQLMEIFQYVVNIPANTPNSEYTQISGKQVKVSHNFNYSIFHKLALIIKDKTIPFTIDFNTNISKYHKYLVPNIDKKVSHIIVRLILIQTFKDRADSSIKYTLFEEAINYNIKRLMVSEIPIDFIKIKEPLNESIKAMENLHLTYLKHLEIKTKNNC